MLRITAYAERLGDDLELLIGTSLLTLSLRNPRLVACGSRQTWRWAPSRSLLLNILTNSYFILQPLLNYFRQTLLADAVIACDDTGITLLYPKVPPAFNLEDRSKGGQPKFMNRL